VKLFGVIPLICVVAPTFTLFPVVENVATRAVTLGVLNGMVTAMVFAVSIIAPDAPLIENAVIALLEFGGTLLVWLFPHPATKAASSSTRNNIREYILPVFILFPP